jgi:hypothetical protein
MRLMLDVTASRMALNEGRSVRMPRHWFGVKDQVARRGERSGAGKCGRRQPLAATFDVAAKALTGSWLGVSACSFVEFVGDVEGVAAEGGAQATAALVAHGWPGWQGADGPDDPGCLV